MGFEKNEIRVNYGGQFRVENELSETDLFLPGQTKQKISLFT